MADVKLTLTAPDGYVFTFVDTEIPHSIVFGGDQKIARHELIGGVRVIDVLGRSDAPLEWEGLFLGKNAESRARYLDLLRARGDNLSIKWGGFSYEGVITSYRPNYERFYQIPYEITIEVSKDLTNPITSSTMVSIDEAVAKDMAKAKAKADKINDDPLNKLMSSLDSAIKTVSSIATAANSVITNITGTIAAIQSRVNLLLASTANTIQNVGTLGGVLPGNSISKSAGSVTKVSAAMSNATDLYDLSAVMGRMSYNVAAGSNAGTNVSPGMAGVRSTYATVGGNLYQIAAEVYGDPSQWDRIAAANNLTDPVVTGAVVLKIPPPLY